MLPDYKPTSGFLEKGSTTPQSDTERRMLFDCGTLCLQGGRPGDAYACYSRIHEPNSAVWFNRSLCLLRGGEYSDALRCLQQALSSTPAAAPARPADGVQSRLDERDAAGEGYLFPMAYAMPQLFPDAARRQILRVIVDTSYLAGRYDEVRRIAGSLRKHYKNVDDILKLIAK